MSHIRTPVSARSANVSGRWPSIGRALLLLVIAGMPCRAWAADASAASSVADTTKPVMFLRQTLVTGARYPRAYYNSPQALSFLTRADLREKPPTVIGDALYNLPGVDNSKDSPWEQRPVLRGLGQQRVLVLMDGDPINSARGNGPHPSLVDASQIERVEVVRGPSSVAYGSDALGGVVNIITRQGSDATSGSSMRGAATLGGSSADKQMNGSLQLMPQMGRFSAFLSTGGRKADDFRTPDNGNIASSSFSDYNAIANLRFALTEHTALKGGWQLYRGHDIGIPGLTVVVPGATPTSPDAFSQDFKFPFYKRDAAHVAVEHSYDSNSWFSNSSLKTYWQDENRDFFSHMAIDFTGAPGFPPGTVIFKEATDRYFRLGTVGVQLQANSRKFDRYRLSFGVDAARDMTHGTNVAHDRFDDGNGGDVFPPSVTVSQSLPTGNFDNLAGFAQSEWYLTRQWTLSAGGRYTHYHYRTNFGIATPASNGGGGPPQPEVDFQAMKVDNDAVAGSGGLVFAAREDLHLSFNVANGYRQPNAQDLFFSGPASVGIVKGDPNLKPERSISSDFGLRWGPGALAFSGNAFYSTYDDLIDAHEVSQGSGGAPNVFQYVNITKARIMGLEAEGEWRIHTQWDVRASATTVRGDITSESAITDLYGIGGVSEVPLPNVPPFKGTASLRWASPGGTFWIEPSTRWSWRTNRLAPPTKDVPQTSQFRKEWIVGDIFAGARFGTGQRVSVGIRNFTDRAYVLPLGSLEEPGISVVGSLSTDF